LWNTFLINSYNDNALTNLNIINKASITKMMWRSSYDLDNSNPGAQYQIVYGSAADQAGTTQDPKLAVVFNMAGGLKFAATNRRISLFNRLGL
jgi:hypothetical protein